MDNKVIIISSLAFSVLLTAETNPDFDSPNEEYEEFQEYDTGKKGVYDSFRIQEDKEQKGGDTPYKDGRDPWSKEGRDQEYDPQNPYAYPNYGERPGVRDQERRDEHPSTHSDRGIRTPPR